MITVTVDASKLIQSLDRLVANFQRESTRAVVKTSTELVGNITDQLLGPPPGPPPTKYERTWRLIHGWGPAAKLLGISLPPMTQFSGAAQDEGTALLYEDVNQTTFEAKNQVPYAREVEFEGTWQAPLGPHADPPNFREAYNTVGHALNEVRSENKFPQYVRDAWKIAKDAA